MRWIVVGVAVMLASGCAYKAETLDIAAFDTVTSYSAKVPGRYLLYVEATSLDTTVRPNQVACSAHNFPVAASQGFRGSVRRTLENIVDAVEPIDSPIPADQLKARGARGLIVVRAENLEGALRVEPGFWSANMSTEVDITASITVDGPGGRLLGTTVEGRGKGQSGAGVFCEGGADSIRQSAEKALKEVVRKIGEAVGNSDRVRTGKAA